MHCIKNDIQNAEISHDTITTRAHSGTSPMAYGSYLSKDSSLTHCGRV